jgi:hypothetical protein
MLGSGEGSTKAAVEIGEICFFKWYAVLGGFN